MFVLNGQLVCPEREQRIENRLNKNGVIVAEAVAAKRTASDGAAEAKLLKALVSPVQGAPGALLLRSLIYKIEVERLAREFGSIDFAARVPLGIMPPDNMLKQVDC